MNTSYYETLKLSPTSSQGDIFQSYQKLKKYYQAKVLAAYSLFDTHDSQEALKDIENAFLILSDPDKKSLYDDKTNFELETSNLRSYYLENLPIHSLDYTRDDDFEVRIDKAECFTGHFLKEIRQYKNISLEEMENRTKVSITHLRNIEADHFTALPADIYLRGFVIQYAKVLKLNETLVAKSYIALRHEL